MLSYFRSKIASRRLKREFKECQCILMEVKQKLVDKHTHREQRRSLPLATSVISEQDDIEESATAANEADIEEGDEDSDEERDGDDNDGGQEGYQIQHGEEKNQQDIVPRLGDHFHMKLNFFLNDIRSSCETYAGNSPPAPSSLSSPASGLILGPGTFERVYGGDDSEVILGLLDACILGSNADQLSNSRRSLARRAANIRNTPASGDATIVYDCLVMLEVLLRERKYQTMVAETVHTKKEPISPLKKLLQILEAVDDIESKKLVLQMLVHVAETPTNRLHVARAKGPKRILRLLLIKDEDLFYDVMQTLRLFLMVPENNGVTSEVLSNDNINESCSSDVGINVDEGETKTNLENGAFDQPDATIGLMSMFRELGKLMPWVEGDGETQSSSTVGNLKNSQLLKGSVGGSVESTDTMNREKYESSDGSGDGSGDGVHQNYSDNSSTAVERTSGRNKRKIPDRPTAEYLNQYFKFAKIAMREEPFLDKNDVTGAGLAKKHLSSSFLSSTHASNPSANSLSNSSMGSVSNLNALAALSTSPESLPNSYRGVGTEGVVFQDFLRSQGALTILTQMLHQELEEEVVRQEQVLEVLDALQIMLGDSIATNDFAAFGGYNILVNIPAKLLSAQRSSRRRSCRLKSRSDLSVSSESSGVNSGNNNVLSNEDIAVAELTRDDVVVAIEQGLQSFFTTMIHLMVGTSTVTDAKDTNSQKVKTARDGLLSDTKCLHVVINLLLESKDQAIVRHAMICLLDLIKINSANITYIQTFGAVHFALHNVTNVELMFTFSGTPTEWEMRMGVMDKFLRHAAVPLLCVDTTILKHYITSIKQFLLAIVEGPPSQLPVDSWVSLDHTLFVELVMKHIGRLLQTISALIGDAHSEDVQLQLGAVSLVLDVLGDQLRLLRRWSSLLRWSREMHESGLNDNVMFSMDFDHVQHNSDERSNNSNGNYNGGNYYDNRGASRPTQQTAVYLNHNVLMTLEIIGMLTLSDYEHEFATFEKRQGWRLILNSVRSSIDLSRLAHGVEGTHPVRGQRVTASTPQQPVSELALWLLRELTFTSAAYEEKPRGGNGIRCIIRLLRETWHKVTLNILDSASSVDPSFIDPSRDIYSDSSDDEPDFGLLGSQGSNTPVLSLRLAVLQLIAELFTTNAPASRFMSSKQKYKSSANGFDEKGKGVPTSTRKQNRTIEEILILMKTSFGKQGGLTQLVDIVCRKPKRRYSSIVACNAHVAESKSAFHALGEALRNCEYNKQQIGSHYGFISLATKLKESLLKLDDQVFDTLIGLAIADGGSVPSVLKNGQANYSSMESANALSLSLSLLPRVVHILNPKGLWPFEESCTRSEFIPHAGTRYQDVRGSPTCSLDSGSNVHTRSSSSDSSSTLNINATTSTNDSVHRYKSSPINMVADLTNLHQISNSSEGSPEPSMSLRPIESTNAASSAQNKDTILAITKRFAEFEAAMRKISEPKNNASNTSGGLNNDMTGSTNFFSSKFRSTEAAVMIVMLIPDAPASTQTSVLHAVLQLVDANPCNARSLCDMQVPMFLLRVAPQLPENVIEKYFQLISRLLSYDVDPDVAVLMFRLSQCDPSWIETAFNNRTEASRNLVQHLFRSDYRESATESKNFDLIQQRNDLQSLVLYTLSANMERKAPLSYFHFDGTGGALRTPRFGRFPLSHTGYSCSFWVKNNSFSCPEPTLFSWGFPHSNKMVLQLFFMKPRLDLGNNGTNSISSSSIASSISGNATNHQYRYLCVRSWAAVEPSMTDSNSSKSEKLAHLVPVKCFNGHKWTGNGGWHHVAMTQERNEFTLYINGIPIDSTWILPVQLRDQSASLYRATLYPGSASTTSSKSTVSKDKPLCGYIARRADEISGTNNFCGMLGPVRIVEGKWDSSHARSLYANGCQFEGELSDIGIPGKTLLFANAASFADLGRNKSDPGRRSQSSLSVHFKLSRKNAESSGRLQNSNKSSSKPLSHSYTEDPRTAWGGSANSYDSQTFLSPSRYSNIQSGKVESFQWRSDTRENISVDGMLSNMSKNQLSQSLKSPILNSINIRSPERRSLGGRSFYYSESRSGKRRGNSMNDDSSSGDLDDFMLPRGTIGSGIANITERSHSSLIEIEGNVYTHNTSSMKSAIQEMDGLLLVCKFLAMGHTEQAAGLRMISLLVKQNSDNTKAFSSLIFKRDKSEQQEQETKATNHLIDEQQQLQQQKLPNDNLSTEHNVEQFVIPGFNIVHYLLVKFKRWWNAEIFDILFDMVTDHVTSIEKHVEKHVKKHVEILAGHKKHGNKGITLNPSGLMSNQSLLSNQQETLNLLLYCLMELDIKNNLSFVRSILGTFVEFLGENPQNLQTLRKHPFGQSDLDAKQNINEGHQMGCGMLYLITLMIEIIGSAMINDTEKGMRSDFHDPRSSDKSVFGGAVTTSSETEFENVDGQSQRYTPEKIMTGAVSAELHAVLFPVVGLIRSVLLNCNPKQQVESQTTSTATVLSATNEELRITFDFLISDAQHLPTETSQVAAEFVKIQVIESILGIIGSLQNTKAAWLLDAMRTIPESPWDIPFALLSSKESRLRLAGLKLLDIFLKGTPRNNRENSTVEQRRAATAAQKQFSKMRGFSIVQRMSENWPVTASTLNALMSLATSPHPPNGIINHGTIKPTKKYLIFPSVLRTVLSVLKRCNFDKRHISARILDEIEMLFTPLNHRNHSDTKEDTEDINRVRHNIEAMLDKKTSARHWIYWFYDTIRYREEIFLLGAQGRWSLGGQEVSEESLSYHEGEDSDSASNQHLRRSFTRDTTSNRDTDEDDPSDSSDGNSTSASSTTKSPYHQVFMAEEARERYDRKTYSPKLSPKSTGSILSPMLSPRSEGSIASAAGMSNLSLDSNLSPGTDSRGGFGVYVPLYQIIRRLLLHDMCRSWRKTSSRLFNELLQMASLDETTTTTMEQGGGLGAEGDSNRNNSRSGSSGKGSSLEEKTGKNSVPPSVVFTPMESAAPVNLSQERDKDNVFHPITFVASVLEDLMEFIEAAPQMPLAPSFTAFNSSIAAKTAATTNTMRNLVSLFDILTHRIMVSEAMQQRQLGRSFSKDNYINNDNNNNNSIENISFIEKYAPTPELIARAVGAVSALAAQNENVRSRMNETGLLAVQEQLLMRCLSPFMLSSWEWDTRIHPILSMEAVFERAAVSKSFIAGNGVLFLVQLFIDMTTIQPVGGADDTDRHLKQVQTKTSQMLSNVFNASTVCLRELIRVVNDSEAIDILLNVFNCSRTVLSQSQSSSWWSSTSGGSQEEPKNSKNNQHEDGSSSVRRLHPSHYLNVWVKWINDEENVQKKTKLRNQVVELLAPVYKTTKNTIKRAIKSAAKAIQKHSDRHDKYRRKEQEEQLEGENRCNQSRINSTKRLSARLQEARHAREVSLGKGEEGYSNVCHLDEFYDRELFPSHWEKVGSVDPWELMFAFHEETTQEL
jgi:hypothetical protein